nr:hypothetical protein [Tanacetum cinerariifolium]
MEDLKQQYLDELKCLSNLEYRDEVKIAELTENFNGMSIEIRKKEKLLQQEQWAYLSIHPFKCLTSFCYDDDDDEDYTSAITPDEPVLSTEELDNSKVFPNISVMPFHDNSPPLDVSKDQFEDLSEFNDKFSSIDDDSFSFDKIIYVEALPFDSELVSSEVMEIVIPEVGGIDDDILLTIKDDVLREKLLNVNLLIAKIEALNANPTTSSDYKTKSSSTSLNSLLEETNTFDNSLPEFETFCFDVEEISSGSTTTHPDISLPEYEVFHEDHVKEISSGSPNTHFDSSFYASFIFDLSINPFPPADRSDFYKFTDELIPFISPPDLQRQQTQMAAKIKDQDWEISGLKARVKFLEGKDRGSAEPTQEDAPIKGGIIETGEEVGVDKSTKIGSNDTDEMVNVLSSMEAVNILTSGVAAVSVSPVVGVSTKAKDKGKEKVVESEVPKKRKLQEYIDAQVAKEIEEEFARENQRVNEQLARDSEIARLHAEEELKMMIEGLDGSNEVIAKHLQEYEQAVADLSVGEKICDTRKIFGFLITTLLFDFSGRT